MRRLSSAYKFIGVSELPRSVVARNPGDGWGAAAVGGLGETVEKEVVEAPSLCRLQRGG